MATPAFPRMLRTGLTASLVVGLGVGGHIAGGGLLPDPVVLAALCALVLIPVTALTRSRFSFPLLTAVLGAGQVWLHWSLVAFAPGPVPALAQAQLTSDPFGHAGHIGHAGHVGHLPALWTDAAVIAAPSPPEAGAGWAMVTAHAVATLAAALLLARGDEALRLLAAWLQPLVRLPAPFVLPPAVRAAWPADEACLPVAPARRLPALRGPPAVVTAG